VDELTKRRLARNEALFRQVNEEVEAVEARYGSSSGGFICECADPACSAAFHLPLEEYERIRAHDNWFIVLPGHQLPEIEETIERHDRYLVVEKTVALNRPDR
jgi:hypothetical protein